jgi:hypothetical protein
MTQSHDSPLTVCTLYLVAHSQGCVERSNAVLRRLLVVMCGLEVYQDVPFEDLLEECQYWMNSAHHRSIKTSSYMLVYGRIPGLLPALAPFDVESEIEKGLADADQQAKVAGKAVPVPLLECAAAAAHIEDRAAAAAANQDIYQSQWSAQVNRAASDKSFSVGECVLMNVVSNRKHKSIARQMDKQRVLLVRALRWSKFNVYTIHGMLKTSVHANELTSLPAGAEIPSGLRLDAAQISSVLVQYDRKRPKPITIDTFITRLLEFPYVPVSATVEMGDLTAGAADFNPVVRIQRKRKMQA